MLVSVKVKPGAKVDKVEVAADGGLRVSVKAPPVDGKANDAVIALLAGHFGLRRSAVTLKRGASGRDKVLEVEGALEIGGVAVNEKPVNPRAARKK